MTHMWLWPIIGMIVGVIFAMTRINGGNHPLMAFIGVCLGLLAGIVLGPFTIMLFFEKAAK